MVTLDGAPLAAVGLRAGALTRPASTPCARRTLRGCASFGAATIRQSCGNYLAQYDCALPAAFTTAQKETGDRASRNLPSLRPLRSLRFSLKSKQMHQCKHSYRSSTHLGLITSRMRVPLVLARLRALDSGPRQSEFRRCGLLSSDSAFDTRKGIFPCNGETLGRNRPGP